MNRNGCGRGCAAACHQCRRDRRSAGPSGSRPECRCVDLPAQKRVQCSTKRLLLRKCLLSVKQKGTHLCERRALRALPDQEVTPKRVVPCFTSNTGRSLRGGRLSPRRICAVSISSSARVRLRVLRCIPSSFAALHWFPLWCASTVVR